MRELCGLDDDGRFNCSGIVPSACWPLILLLQVCERVYVCGREFCVVLLLSFREYLSWIWLDFLFFIFFSISLKKRRKGNIWFNILDASSVVWFRYKDNSRTKRKINRRENHPPNDRDYADRAYIFVEKSWYFFTWRFMREKKYQKLILA